MPRKKTASDKNLAELGRHVQAIYEMGYVSPRRVLWFSFLRGLVTGFGAFLGGTILITLLAATLGLFNDLPLIDGLVETIRRSLEK